jgi:hypothetical protein
VSAFVMKPDSTSVVGVLALILASCILRQRPPAPVAPAPVSTPTGLRHGR